MKRSRQEEKWNAITHAFGMGMCFSFFLTGELETQVIYFMLCLTFLCSVLYHSIEKESAKNFFRMLDMMSIHATVACTSVAYMSPYDNYLPYVCLLAGAVGSQYIVCAYGTRLLEKTAVISFVGNGILCLSIMLLSSGSLPLMFVVGCAVYLIGLYFYIHDYIPYYHTVWHAFVILASFLHVLGTM